MTEDPSTIRSDSETLTAAIAVPWVERSSNLPLVKLAGGGAAGKDAAGHAPVADQPTEPTAKLSIPETACINPSPSIPAPQDLKIDVEQAGGARQSRPSPPASISTASGLTPLVPLPGGEFNRTHLDWQPRTHHEKLYSVASIPRDRLTDFINGENKKSLTKFTRDGTMTLSHQEVKLPQSHSSAWKYAVRY